jgi:ATP-dependent exoDNAse (exonuclease V) beta subunit
VTAERDFGPLDDRGARRQTVASAIADEGLADEGLADGGADAGTPRDDGEESDRLVGSLVHRLLQREGLAGPVDDERIGERLTSLVRVDEWIAVTGREALIGRAAAAYRAFSTHRDLRALYESGTAFHEVPFSLAAGDRVVRGTIDCLVSGSGVVTVLEFKTGRRRPEHQRQADLYRQAALTLFPDRRVVTQLLYASEAAGS